MKPSYIVYTSNTGHTARYAKLLSEKTALPALSLAEATEKLAKGTPILYLGWLFVGGIRGYKKAAKRYSVCAVCGVGLCDTGALHVQAHDRCSDQIHAEEKEQKRGRSADAVSAGDRRRLCIRG